MGSQVPDLEQSGIVLKKNKKKPPHPHPKKTKSHKLSEPFKTVPVCLT